MDTEDNTTAPGGGAAQIADAPLGPDETTISHDWALRRLDLYAELERTLRDGIAGALEAAAAIRADVERDAGSFLSRLSGERDRVAGELAALEERRREAELSLEERRAAIEAELTALRSAGEAAIEEQRAAAEAEVAALRETTEADLARQRETTEEELTGLRAETEAEVAALRATTRAAIDQQVQEAEARRGQVAAEVRTLEEQVAQIQGVIDSFLDNQLQTLRGSLGGARPRGEPPRPAGRGPQTAGQGPLGDLGQSGPGAGDADAGVVGGAAGGAGTVGVSGGVPGGVGAVGAAGGAGTAGSMAGAPGRAAGAGGIEGWPPSGEHAPPAAELLAGALSGALADVSAPADAGGAQRTAVVITGVPHFSRARALWQAIQEVPGVAEARAINYQGGVLALEVQHDAALDLSASVTELPGLRLRVAEAEPGELRLAAEA